LFSPCTKGELEGVISLAVKRKKLEEHYLVSEISALIEGLCLSEKAVEMWTHINKCKICQRKEEKIRTDLFVNSQILGEDDWDEN